MAVPTYDFPRLTQLMEGKNTLHGWDMLVSYDEDMVNKLLQASGRHTGLMNDIVLNGLTYTDDFTGETITADFTVKIHDLTLTFLDTSASVQLFLPFSGQENLTEGGVTKTRDVPPGYRISAKTSLANMSAGIQGGVLVTEDGNESFPAGTGAKFDMAPGRIGSFGVFLLFKSPEVDIQQDPNALGPNSTQGGAVKLSAILSAALVNYLETTQHLKVYLAGSTNYPVSVPGTELVFAPDTFAFTCIPGDPTANPPISSTLCTWMTLYGSGAQPEGSSQLIFEVADPNVQGSMAAASPRPTGCSASIIISHNAFTGMFMKPALKSAKGFTDITVTSQTGTPGVSLSLGMPPQNLGFDSYDWRSWDGGEEDQHDGLSINSSDTPATLSITNGIITGANSRASFNYATPSQNVGFSNSWGQNTRWPGETSCSADFSSSLGASTAWGDTTTETPSFIMNINGAYNVNISPSDTSIWAKFAGNESWPSNCSMSPLTSPPNCSLGKGALPNLDLILTTNLLFPGQHVFQGDKVLSSDENSSTGMAIPRDVILTGSLKVPTSAKRILQIQQRQTRGKEFTTQESREDPVLRGNLLEEFKDELWNSANLGLLFGIMRAGRSDSKITMTRYLETKGYGALTPDDILAGMGLTAHEVLGSSPKLDGVRDDATTQGDIDLRYFAGLYTITSPAADKGKLVLIKPFNKTIQIQGVEVSPTQQSDPSTGRKINEFVFTVKEAAYHILVNASVDDKTGVITPSLSGSVTRTALEPFAASWREIHPEGVNDPTAHDVILQSSNISNNLGDWKDKFFALVGLFCACCRSASHAGEQAAAEAAPEAPRAAALQSALQDMSNGNYREVARLVRERQSRMITDQTAQLGPQAIAQTREQRREAIFQTIHDVPELTANRLEDALEEKYDSGISRESSYQSMLENSRSIAVRRSQTLVSESLGSGDVGSLEREAEEVDLSDPEEFEESSAAAVTEATEAFGQSTYAIGSTAALEAVRTIADALIDRRAASAASIDRQVAEAQVQADQVERDRKQLEADVQKAEENHESESVIEQLKKDLAEKEAEAKRIEDQINRSKDEGEEERKEAEKTEEKAKDYPEEAPELTTRQRQAVQSEES